MSATLYLSRGCSMSARFSELFGEYVAPATAAATERRRDEAVAFSQFIAEESLAGRAGGPTAAELARYEACWVQAATPGARLTLPLVPLVPPLRSSDGSRLRGVTDSPPPLNRPSSLARSSGDARLRYLSVSLPASLARLLKRGCLARR